MLQEAGEMKCKGDATCQVIDPSAGARKAIGTEMLFRRLRMLCVATVATVPPLITVDVGSIMKVVVVDVDVDVE